MTPRIVARDGARTDMVMEMADSTNRSETIAAPIHDPGLLERAGWTNAEVIREQIQETAAERARANDRSEASEPWRGALEEDPNHP